VHHTIEAGRVLQEVVNTGHDTEDAEGEKVNTDNGDNAKNSKPQIFWNGIYTLFVHQ
jgi:hypothetical protein